MAIFLANNCELVDLNLPGKGQADQLTGEASKIINIHILVRQRDMWNPITWAVVWAEIFSRVCGTFPKQPVNREQIMSDNYGNEYNG